MAIIVTFDLPGAGQDLYDTVIDRVTQGQGFTRFADLPNPGLLSHAAGPVDGGFRVTEIWESEEALAHHARTFAPVLAALGHTDLKPTIIPAHHYVTR
ncbi:MULTISPECIES: hypothetical protein [Streptomyces]|uniref:hypothetical protein n=1 Tax=Streptomyces TaxID=1883 RepID=UPI00167E6770|nr:MULTISPECIES: hypothetical protein [Streptomyces]MCM1945207.1 hypothetical protein [Streptomyces sp. G2]